MFNSYVCLSSVYLFFQQDATHCAQAKAARSTLIDMLQILDKSVESTDDKLKGN